MHKEYKIKTNGGDEFTFFTNEENNHCINVSVQNELVAGIILDDSEASEIAKVIQPDLKNVFAKIFEFKGSQVVVTKEDDEDDDESPFYIRIEIRNIQEYDFRLKLGYIEEETRNRNFQDLSQENLTKTLNLHYSQPAFPYTLKD